MASAIVDGFRSVGRQVHLRKVGPASRRVLACSLRTENRDDEIAGSFSGSTCVLGLSELHADSTSAETLTDSSNLSTTRMSSISQYGPSAAAHDSDGVSTGMDGANDAVPAVRKADRKTTHSSANAVLHPVSATLERSGQSRSQRPRGGAEYQKICGNDR
jgi:hypothetical protein